MTDFGFVSVLGMLGAMSASSIFIPQVFASYRNRRTKDIAWFTVILGTANGMIWIGYGLIKEDPFIYVTNIISFVASFLLMLLKKKYG